MPKWDILSDFPKNFLVFQNREYCQQKAKKCSPYQNEGRGQYSLYRILYNWRVIAFAVEGGMDFRAMLMKRKKPAKKVVVVRIMFVSIISQVSQQVLDSYLAKWFSKSSLSKTC